MGPRSPSHERSRSFGTVAHTYAAGRPDYPTAAVAWLLEPASSPGDGANVVDVGAGTGKLTRTVASLGASARAIDPDPDMLSGLRTELPDVPVAVGTAEHLPLADSSADAIVSGQAWHWVDPEAGSAECARVLRPGGVLGLVWNIRDTSVDWVRRMSRIMHDSAAEEMIADDAVRIGVPFGEPERATWDWERAVTRQALVDMVHSRSRFITATPDERERIDSHLSALFDSLGLRGDATIALPYRTHAYRAIRP